MDFIRFDKKVEHPLIVCGVMNSESDTDSESNDTPKKVNKSFDTVTPKKVNESFDMVGKNIEKNVVNSAHIKISNIKEKSSFNTTNNIFKPSSNSLFSMAKNTSVFESKDNNHNEKKTCEGSSFEFNFDTKEPIRSVDARNGRQQDKVNIVENVDISSLSPRVDNSFKKQKTVVMKRDSNKSVPELLELRSKLEEIDEKISKQSELCLKCDRQYNEVTNAISIKLEKHISETRDVMSKHMDCVPIRNDKNVIDDYVMSRLLSLEQQINISSTESRISLVEDRIGITTPYPIHSVMNRLNKLESYFEGQKTSIRRLHQDNINLLHSIRLNSQTLQANSLIADDRNSYLANSLRQIDEIERRQRKLQQLIFICFTTAFIIPFIGWLL